MTGQKFSRGIEKVIALAALDGEFRAKLLTDRKAAIDASGVELSENERGVLQGISDSQLETAINGVRVPSRARRLFLKGAVIAAVALVIGTCIVLPEFVVSVKGATVGASAISSLRTISSAQAQYITRFDTYATLEKLADEGLVDRRHKTDEMPGYRYKLKILAEDSYEVRAIPLNRGELSFYMDQTGAIRYSETSEVGPDSKTLDR